MPTRLVYTIACALALGALAACSSSPAPAAPTTAPATTAADPHLSAFQNALNGEGITVNDTVAQQWATAACSATTVNQAQIDLDNGVLANQFTLPAGQTENVAEAAIDFYCPQPSG